MQRFFTEIRKADGGLSCYGEEEVRTATDIGAVDTLLLSESLNSRRITVQCALGHTHELTVKNADDRVQCSDCGSTTTIIKDEDLIDDFFLRAESFNTRVHIISSDSEEGDMLIKAFGGIAGLLRYKVN